MQGASPYQGRSCAPLEGGREGGREGGKVKMEGEVKRCTVNVGQ